MKTYIVTSERKTTQSLTCHIKAESEEQAIEKAESGDFDPVETEDLSWDAVEDYFEVEGTVEDKEKPSPDSSDPLNADFDDFDPFSL